MATLIVRIQDLATRIATESKSLRMLLNGNAAGLTALTTTAKTNLVDAINELDADITTLQGQTGAQINDASVTSGTQTWSVDKIKSELLAQKNALTNGAAATLDTLSEIAAALGNDANFAATMTAALGNRVRFDSAQTLTAPQKVTALANIGAAAAPDLAALSAAIGNPDTDFTTTFTTGLV